MRWPLASLAVSSCAVVLAACGGGGGVQRLPDAKAWAARAELAAVDLEAGRQDDALLRLTALRLAVIRAVNAGRVPADLQEELLSRVNEAVELLTPAAARSLAGWLRERGG